MDRGLSRSTPYLPRYQSASPARSPRLGRKVHVMRSTSQPRSRILYTTSSPSPHRAIYSCHVHHSPSPQRSYRHHLVAAGCPTPTTLTRKSKSLSSHDVTSSHLYTSQEDLMSGSLREVDASRRVVSSDDIYHKGPFYPDATQSESGVSMGESDEGSMFEEDDTMSQHSFGSSSAFFEATIDSELSDSPHGATGGATSGGSVRGRRQDLHSPDSNRSSPLSYKETRKRELMSSPSGDFDKIQSRFQALKVSIPGTGEPGSTSSAKSPRDRRVSPSPLAQSTPHVSPRGHGEARLSIKACWNVDDPEEEEDDLGRHEEDTKKSSAVRTLFPLDVSDSDIPTSARAEDSSCNSSFSEDNAADISSATVSSLDYATRRTKLVKKASDPRSKQRSNNINNISETDFVSGGDSVMRLDTGPQISALGDVRSVSTVSSISEPAKAEDGDNGIAEKESSPAGIVGNEWWAVYNIESANAREKKEKLSSGDSSPTNGEPRASEARPIRVVKPVKVSNIPLPLISAGKQGQEKLRRRSQASPPTSPHSGSPTGSLSPVGTLDDNKYPTGTDMTQREKLISRSVSPENEPLHASRSVGDTKGEAEYGRGVKSNEKNENGDGRDGEKKEDEAEEELALYEARIASGAFVGWEERERRNGLGNESEEIERGNLWPGDRSSSTPETFDSTSGMKNDQQTSRTVRSEGGPHGQGKQSETNEETESGERFGANSLPLPVALPSISADSRIDKDGPNRTIGIDSKSADGDVSSKPPFGDVEIDSESSRGIDGVEIGTMSISENDVTVAERLKKGPDGWTGQAVDLSSVNNDSECPAIVPDNYSEEEQVENSDVIQQSTPDLTGGHYLLDNFSPVGRWDGERRGGGVEGEAGSSGDKPTRAGAPLPGSRAAALAQVFASLPPAPATATGESKSTEPSPTTRGIEGKGLWATHQSDSGEKRERREDKPLKQQQEEESEKTDAVSATVSAESEFSEIAGEIEPAVSSDEANVLSADDNENIEPKNAYVSTAVLVFCQGQSRETENPSSQNRLDIFRNSSNSETTVGESQLFSTSIGEIRHVVSGYDEIGPLDTRGLQQDGEFEKSALSSAGVSEGTEGFPDDTTPREGGDLGTESVMERSSIGAVSARHHREFPAFAQQQKRVRVVVATAQKTQDDSLRPATGDGGDPSLNIGDTASLPSQGSAFSPPHTTSQHHYQQQQSVFSPCFPTSTLPGESFDHSQGQDVSSSNINNSATGWNNSLHNSYSQGFGVDNHNHLSSQTSAGAVLGGTNHTGPQETQDLDFTGKFSRAGGAREAAESWPGGESIHESWGSEPRHDKGIQHRTENLNEARQKNGIREGRGEQKQPQFEPVSFVERAENYAVSLPRKQVEISSQHVKRTHRTTTTTVEKIVTTQRRVNPAASEAVEFGGSGFNNGPSSGFVDIVTDKHITETVVKEDDDYIRTTTTTNTLYPDSGVGDSSFVSTLNTPEDYSFDSSLNDSNSSVPPTTHPKFPSSSQVCKPSPRQGVDTEISERGFTANSSVYFTPVEQDSSTSSIWSRSSDHGDTVPSHGTTAGDEGGDSCHTTTVSLSSSSPPSRLSDPDKNNTRGGGDTRPTFGVDSDSVTSSILGTHSQGVNQGQNITDTETNKAGSVCPEATMYHSPDSSHVLDTLHAQLSQLSSPCDPAGMGSNTTNGDVQNTFRSSVNGGVYHDHAEATSVLKQIVRGEFQEFNFSAAPPPSLAKFPTSIPTEDLSDVKEHGSSVDGSEKEVAVAKEHYDNEYDYVTTDLPQNGNGTSRHHHIQLLKPGHLKASSLWTLQEETESLLDACSPNASPKRSLSNTTTAGAEDENRHSLSNGLISEHGLPSLRGPQMAKDTDAFSDTGESGLSLFEVMRQRRSRVSESPEFEGSDGNYSSISTVESSSRRSSSYGRERTPLSDADSALPSLCEEKMDYQEWVEGVTSSDQISSFHDFVSGLRRPGDLALDDMDTDSLRDNGQLGSLLRFDQQPPAPSTFKTSLAFTLDRPENEMGTSSAFQALENLSASLEQFSTTSGFQSANQSFTNSTSSTVEAGGSSAGMLNTSGNWADEVLSEASSRLHAIDLDLSRISSCASPVPSDFSESSNFVCTGTAEVKRIYNFDYDTVPAAPPPQPTSKPKEKPLKSALKRPLPPEESYMTERQRETFKMFDEILHDFNKKTSPTEAIQEVRFLEDSESQSSSTAKTTSTSSTTVTTTATTATTVVPGSPPNTNFSDLYKDFTNEESEKKQSHTCVVVEDENMGTFRFKRFLKKSHTRRNKKGRRVLRFLSRLGCVSESVHSPDMSANRKQLSLSTPEPSQTFSTDSMPSPKIRKISHPVLISSTSFQHHPEFLQDRVHQDHDSALSSPDKSPVKSTPSSSNQSLDSLRSRTDSAYSSVSESTPTGSHPSHFLSPVTVHPRPDKREVEDRTLSDSAFSVTPGSATTRTFSVFSEAVSPNPDWTITNLGDSSKPHNPDMLTALSDVFDQLDVCEGEIDTALLNRLRHGHYQAQTGHRL